MRANNQQHGGKTTLRSSTCYAFLSPAALPPTEHCIFYTVAETRLIPEVPENHPHLTARGRGFSSGLILTFTHHPLPSPPSYKHITVASLASHTIIIPLHTHTHTHTTLLSRILTISPLYSFTYLSTLNKLCSAGVPLTTTLHWLLLM